VGHRRNRIVSALGVTAYRRDEPLTSQIVLALNVREKHFAVSAARKENATATSLTMDWHMFDLKRVFSATRS
jgi:hypothetical protein